MTGGLISEVMAHKPCLVWVDLLMTPVQQIRHNPYRGFVIMPYSQQCSTQFYAGGQYIYIYLNIYEVYAHVPY